MRLKPCWGALAAAMVAGAFACNGSGASGDIDAGPNEADGGPHTGDAGTQASLTDDIAGGWRFDVGEAPSVIMSCGVVIGHGDFEITCPDPEGPYTVNDTCVRIRNEIRISGDVTGGDPAVLNGGVDVIEEYEGDGCAAAGYSTGIPTVTEGIAWLWAQRMGAGGGDGFWSAVNGTWTFELTEAQNPLDFLACTVTLDGGAFTIECPIDGQLEAIPGCWETTGGILSGTVGASAMSGEAHDVIHREGMACEPAGLPLYEEGMPLPISATRL